MTAKEYLNRYRKMKIIVEQKKEQIAELDCRIKKVTSTLTEDKVQSSGVNDRMAEGVSEMMDLQKKWIKDVVEKKKILNEIMETIHSIEEPELMKLLYMRYVKFKTWVEIAYEMEISYQWVHELHGKALKKVSDLIEVDSPHVI